MLSKIFTTRRILFAFIFILLILTRFFKLDWGNGYFFNPDENNMAAAISQMNFKNLNPHFFAYGQFPLYLTFFSFQLINLIFKHHFLSSLSFAQSIFGLRVWSTIFSIASIILLFLISKKIFKKETHSLIFVLLLIFNPGLIQLAHFGTTESILFFVFVFNIYLAQKLISKQKIAHLFLAALISGIGIGTKISALILLSPIFVALLINLVKHKKWITYFIYNFIFVVCSILFAAIFSPYNLIAWPDFLASMNYEIAVATGKIVVFYTRQFLNSTPYLFQLTHIFPYVSGLPVYIFSLIGFIFLICSFIKKPKINSQILLIAFPVILYFIYQGQLFVKWTRFMSPIFFIFPLMTTFLIGKFKNKILSYFVITLSVLPGLVFMNLYFHSDIRVVATRWINQNLSRSSTVLSESGNVMSLPLVNSNDLKIYDFDFYQLDDNPQESKQISQLLSQSNYIFIPSRRVFKNQNYQNFPLSQKYYQNLFSGNLGFDLQKTFSVKTDLFLNPENAEETWTVFDQPTIRIYQKSKPNSPSYFNNLLNI